MIKFNADSYEELWEEINLRAVEVSIEISKAVCKAIDEDANIVSIAILNNIGLDIFVKRENYLETLEVNLARLVEAEEYELCEIIKTYIQKLKD